MVTDTAATEPTALEVHKSSIGDVRPLRLEIEGVSTSDKGTFTSLRNQQKEPTNSLLQCWFLLQLRIESLEVI